MREKIKKLVSKEVFFYIVVFFFIFVLHLFMKFSNDDVEFFCKQLDIYSWFDYIKMRYETWTSRVFIEGILVYFSRHLFLWRICDSLVICLLVYSINKLVFEDKKIGNLIFVTGIVLVYPFLHMKTAGFCATTLNYLWPFTFLLFSFCLFRDLYNGKKINKLLLPFYLLAYLYACNHEQTVCIAVVVSFLIFILKRDDKDFRRCSLIMFFIGIISLLFIVTCPGNEARNIIETNTWYPDYVKADIFDKVYLGVVSTISNLFSYVTILWLFSFVLFILVLKNANNMGVKIVSVLQFLFITVISGIRGYALITGNDYIIFEYFTDVGDVFQFCFKDILILGGCIGLILIFCYLMYVLMKKESFCLILILLIGCGTRLLMGFSPTIFASSTRTMIFLDFSFLIIIICLWKKYKTIFSNRELMIFYLIILGLILVSLVFLFLKVL